MSGPASKRFKKSTTTTASSSKSGTDDPEVVGDSTSPKKKTPVTCIICSGPGSTAIVKNADFESALQLFWCTLCIDVKPDACKKCDLCEACFEKVVTYYETNDIICYFENYFKLKRQELIKATLKGIAVLEKDEKPLSTIQTMVKKQYIDGTGISKSEEEELERALSQFNSEITLTDDKTGKVINLDKTSDVKAKSKISLKAKDRKAAKKSSDSGDDSSD